MYAEKSLREYLNELGARKPAPGGGSASALIAGLGISLLEKAANYTLNNEKYKDSEALMKQIVEKLEALKKQALHLVDEDARAYLKVSEASKSKSDTAPGGDAAAALEAALKESTAVPMDICRISKEALKSGALLKEKGNKYLMSDVEIGIKALELAIEGGRLNVNENIPRIKDKVFVEKVKVAIK